MIVCNEELFHTWSVVSAGFSDCVHILHNNKIVPCPLCDCELFYVIVDARSHMTRPIWRVYCEQCKTSKAFSGDAQHKIGEYLMNSLWLAREIKVSLY